jgi:acetyl-CoA carboxylase carboxyl transferase subunit alpha
MLEHSYYTVAAPEAAADILKFGSAHAALAAEGQRIRACDALEFKIADELIPEPLGGAHKDHRGAADALKAALTKHLAILKELPTEVLLEQRYQKFRAIGEFGWLESTLPSAIS